jgi:ADP-ribose pyrophosphatase YjhB (NUDIX family)
MDKPKFAGSCVIQDGKILLVQESHKEARGLWSLPLGHVEEKENEAEAAQRETKEETGYDVTVGKSKELEIAGEDFKSIRQFNHDSVTLTIFEGKITDGVLKKGDDMLDAQWFALDEIEKLPLRGSWVNFFISK